MSEPLNELFPSPGLFPGPEVFPGEASDSPPVFLPPTIDVPFRIKGRLFGANRMGLTVWRDAAGVWHTGMLLAGEQLAGADRVYAGGRRHLLTDLEVIELSAAGFDEYIFYEEGL